MKHTTLAVLGFWAIALVGPAITVSEASSSRTWVLRDLKSDEDVMLDGVALTADGGIRLSARVIPIFDAAQPNLWCLARDARGRIYAGSGNDGKVFRIDPDGGNPEVIFDSDELEVHAIAFDADDRLYVATSPDGAVFRITPEGMPVMIFDPSETYIWAMVLDDHDRLYVATGHPGRVYRVDHLEPNASGVVVLDGHEENIRTLIRDEKGTLYAGSDQSGIVYRITPPDKTSVIYDSPMREIAAIAVAPGADGEERLYIATLAPLPRRAASSGETPGTGDVTHVQITAEGPDNGEKGEGSEEQQRRRRAARRPTPDRYFGAIYELTTRGYARRLWQSTDALPLSLARLSPQGDGWGEGVLVGTGSAGRVLLVRASGDASEYVTIPSQQVNALIPDGHGAFYAAASNLGQVVRISPGAADSGTVTSPVHDAGFTSTWGTISWTADEPGGAAVTLQVRTGDTEKPDDSWSAWSSAYTDATGEAIRRPHARFVQWRAKLAAGRSGVSPVLRSVRVGYLQENLPPEIGTIAIQSPGVVLQGDGTAGSDRSDGQAAGHRSPAKPRRGFERGKRAAQWEAKDSNDDELRFDVFYKAEDETLWKPLAEDIAMPFVTWDETAMPDGVYRIKVQASDAPSNPPGEELSSARVSPVFEIDNTPPAVGTISVHPGSFHGPGRTDELQLTVTDSFSTIGYVAYSLDAAEWIPIRPVDGIADSVRESYRFTVAGMRPGEHTVTVRARDRAGNTAANKVIIKVGDR